jgi:hypothetical protein
VTHLATVVSKMIFDLIQKKLKKLVKDKKISNFFVSGYPYDKVSFNVFGTSPHVSWDETKDIIIFFYRDTGRISVQILGKWLTKCKKVDKRLRRFVNFNGELVLDECFWNLSGDPEEVSNLIIKKLEENVIPLNTEGEFKECFTCPFQLECLSNRN